MAHWHLIEVLSIKSKNEDIARNGSGKKCRNKVLR